MTEYYAKKLPQGLEFQDFVTDKLMDILGISLSTYQSKKYQLKGENRQGIEIKFDDRMKTTGNLYIETEEKSNPDNMCFVRSGIYRDDNTWLYIIGDYSTLFIFGKQTLRNMDTMGNYRKVEIPTSRGFLIPLESANKYALKVLHYIEPGARIAGAIKD